MAWVKRIALYLDIEEAAGDPLLDGTTSNARSSAPVFVQGDKFRLELYFRAPANSPLNASSAQQLPAGSVVMLAGKLTTELDAAPALFSAGPFSEAGAGDTLCYAADLDMATVELTAAFAAAAETSLTVRVDVEVQNSDNSDRLTYQFDVTVKQQAYGPGTTSGSGAPTYVTAAEAAARFVQLRQDEAWAWFSLTDGRWYHYEQTTNKWYPDIVQIQDGIPVKTLGEGVDSPP